MGFIKDSSISGILPTSEAFAVHYPGYPSSTERAVQTLGGTKGILKARDLQSNKLELHFRPEDPYSHPAFGELVPCNNFLLKISKTKDRDGNANRISEISIVDESNLEKRMHRSQHESGSINAPAEVEAQTPVDMEVNLCADIVVRVSEAYHFNGMVDYQHVLAVHADVARKRSRNWVDIELQYEKGGLMDLDQEDLMILVPPLFSPKDVPENIVLKPSVTLSSKKKQQAVVQHRWEMDIEPCLAIDFNIKEIPKKISWEKYIPQGSDQWEWQMAVCKLFDERPIWIKNSLAEHLLDQGLKFGDHVLRRLLFRAAYYFSNGPFQRFWIKKGYDPRRDPESRIYQRMDFRVPPSLRRYCDTGMAAGLKQRWEDVCAFRVFPYKCQTSLQLFELADDYIQKEIRKSSIQETCTCSTGWFSSSVVHGLRLCVAVRFLSVYPEAGARALLKSARERFEKSKMHIYMKDLQPEEQGQPQVNKELIGSEDQEPENIEEEEEYDDDGNHDVDDDDDDDNDDEIEYGNVEEELNTFEALDLAGEDRNLSPCPSSRMDSENVSKNYLQMLFDSFPFNEVGANQLQDADNSDGEYHIYEQYSDGNYSEDDGY